MDPELNYIHKIPSEDVSLVLPPDKVHLLSSAKTIIERIICWKNVAAERFFIYLSKSEGLCKKVKHKRDRFTRNYCAKLHNTIIYMIKIYTIVSINTLKGLIFHVIHF